MSETKIKQAKKKGPIRFEAIIPVTVICLLTTLYFKLWFDGHIKSVIEYVGTQGNGAEVNVESVNTSFINGSFDLNGLQVTDTLKPTLNSLEIENIHFQFIWDALLRMKFVVEDASINNVQISKPRAKPGKVLPPEPAKPSKMDEIQLEVISQVQKKYSKNVLSNITSLLDGSDYQEQINQIRGDLKSEKRLNAMISDVDTKSDLWEGKIKNLSDTSKIKEAEALVKSIEKEKNFINQAKSVKELTDILKDIQDQYKEVQKASKDLQSEVKAITQYPKEIENLIKEDVESLKDRFSIPSVDFKDMAMNLFAGQFTEYILKARKYKALADQYLPEKKDKEEVIPPKRSEGKSYGFPITKGYPLFWLKRAGISSTGTANSYSGDLKGELTNVTTSPKTINKPILLDMKGNFPGMKMTGVHAQVKSDFTKDIAEQSALIKVASFQAPEKLFVDDEKLKFGFQTAIGSSTIRAKLVENRIAMDWESNLLRPKFLVESKTKLAQEMLHNVVNGIDNINISGKVNGSFSNFDMSLKSNLGDELGNGLKREIGNKVSAAQDKLQSLVNDRISKPKNELLAKIGGSESSLKSLQNIGELYKKNEDQIKKEIEKLKKGGSKDIENKAKKLFKGIKL